VTLAASSRLREQPLAFTREGEGPVWHLIGAHERIEAAGSEGLDGRERVM
jgi:hypothetical protein